MLERKSVSNVAFNYASTCKTCCRLFTEYTYSDPYDAEDYDNADDFAEEWAEEFGDGDYDDGYDDAYDYWEDAID